MDCFEELRQTRDYRNILEFEVTDDYGIFHLLNSDFYKKFMSNILCLYIILNNEDFHKYFNVSYKDVKWWRFSFKSWLYWTDEKNYEKRNFDNIEINKIWDIESLKIVKKYFKKQGYKNLKTNKIEICFKEEEFYNSDYLKHIKSYKESKNSLNFYKSINYYINKLDNLENQIKNLEEDVINIVNEESIKDLGYDSWSKIVLNNMGFYYKPVSNENLRIYKENGYGEEDSRLLNLGDKNKKIFTKDEYLVKLAYKNYIEAKSVIKFEFTEEYISKYKNIEKSKSIESLKNNKITERELEWINSIKLVIEVQIKETIEELIWQYVLIKMLNSYRVSIVSEKEIKMIKEELKKEGLKEKFSNGGNILFIINSKLLINYSEISQKLRSNYWYKQIYNIEKRLNKISKKIDNMIKNKDIYNKGINYYKKDKDQIIKYFKNNNYLNYKIDLMNLNTKFILPIYKLKVYDQYYIINNGVQVLDRFSNMIGLNAYKGSLKLELNYSNKISNISILNENEYKCFNICLKDVWSKYFNPEFC